MTGVVVGVLVAVGVVILLLLLGVSVRRRRASVLGDVSQLGTAAWPGATDAHRTDPAMLPDPGAVPRAAELLGRNDQIGAVKAYRDATGAGLSESSQAVRRWIEAHGGAVDIAEVLRVVQSGRKIEAIKLYRQQTGVGLSAAKQMVEQIAAGTIAPEPVAVPADLVPVQQAMRSGRKIEAIKLYRQQTGVGLAAAKAAVETRHW
jgi:ribosomal protein L7/L12